MAKLPKEGTLFTPDKKKKIEYIKTYRTVRVDFYSLKSWEGIQRNYKKDKEGSKIMDLEYFIEFTNKEKYT